MSDSPKSSATPQVPRRFRSALEQHEKTRGLLIAFEGPEAAGKSTQLKLFKRWLHSPGHEVMTSKWNSSPLVKPLVKARKAIHSVSPEELCLLQAAEFRYRLETAILPALWRGTTVLADQYLFTALAKDAARGLRLDWSLNAYTPLFWPDIVLYFELSPETSARRLGGLRKPKYYEAGQDVTQIDDPMKSFEKFVQRINQEYSSLAMIFQFLVVDAEQSIYNQHRMIRELYQKGERRPWAEWNAEAVVEWLERNWESLGVRLGA